MDSFNIDLDECFAAGGDAGNLNLQVTGTNTQVIHWGGQSWSLPSESGVWKIATLTTNTTYTPTTTTLTTPYSAYFKYYLKCNQSNYVGTDNTTNNRRTQWWNKAVYKYFYYKQGIYTPQRSTGLHRQRVFYMRWRARSNSPTWSPAGSRYDKSQHFSPALYGPITTIKTGSGRSLANAISPGASPSAFTYNNILFAKNSVQNNTVGGSGLEFAWNFTDQVSEVP